MRQLQTLRRLASLTRVPVAASKNLLAHHELRTVPGPFVYAKVHQPLPVASFSSQIDRSFSTHSNRFSNNKRESGPHDQQILRLLDTSFLDYKRLDNAFAKIFHEGPFTVLQHETFFLMVQRFQRCKDPNAAEVLSAFLLGWLVKFHQQGRLDRAPRDNLFRMALNFFAHSGHPYAEDIAKGFVNQVQRLVDQGVIYVRIDASDFDKKYKHWAPQNRTGNAPGLHDREILVLLDTGKVDYEKLDETFSSILNRTTSAVLQLETFFSVVKRLQRTTEPESADAISSVLLGWMMKFHEQGRLDRPPKRDMFGMALNCFAKSQHPNAGELAEQFLDELQKQVEQGSLPINIHNSLFCQAMKPSAIRGNSKRAQAIFDRCVKSFEEGNDKARPGVILWSTLIDAYAKSGQSDAGDLALAKLKEAEESGLQLDTICYSTVIDACAQSIKPELAESVLGIMADAYASGNVDAQPDLRCLNQTLNAWARTKSVNGAKRSEILLNRMIETAEDTNLFVDAVSYSTVTSAYGRVGLPRDAARILEKQHADFLEGNHAAQPRVRDFFPVISAWSNSGEPEAGEVAEQILDHMDELYKKGTLKRPPDAFIYNGVIKAWGVVGAFQRAEKIFDRLLGEFKSGNLAAKPDLYSFSTLLDAYATAKLPNAGELADGILDQMEQMEVEPDLAVYTAAHHCWHCSKGHDPRAEQRYDELDSHVEFMRGKLAVSKAS